MIMAWRDREGWLIIVFLGWLMVEWRTRNRVMRGDGGNYHEKLEPKRMSCASQFSTIPNIAGISPNSAGNNTDTRSSKPNQTSCTPDFSYPIVSSILFPSSSPLSLIRPQLYHYCRTQSQVIPLYLSMSWLWVNTVYSIHQIQYTPKIVCFPFMLTITSWPLNVASASSVPPNKINRHQPALYESSKVKSPCHIPMVVSYCN